MFFCSWNVHSVFGSHPARHSVVDDAKSKPPRKCVVVSAPGALFKMEFYILSHRSYNPLPSQPCPNISLRIHPCILRTLAFSYLTRSPSLHSPCLHPGRLFLPRCRCPVGHFHLCSLRLLARNRAPEPSGLHSSPWLNHSSHEVVSLQLSVRGRSLCYAFFHAHGPCPPWSRPLSSRETAKCALLKRS